MKKLLLAFLLFISIKSLITAQNVVTIIIDGARYTETFGDPSRTNIPYMNELSHQGTYIDNFYNDGYTYTSRAVPALWCGNWTNVTDTTYNGSSTQYTEMPSIFEYFEKQKNPGDYKNVYVLKYINSLWLQSFHQDYGQSYWPTTFSQGDNDEDVLETTLQIMNGFHPQFLWVYLADVDHAGHSGNWNEYVIAIKIADSIVNEIWSAIQNDPFYADNTTMMVTNDHGRHTTDFSGHGCSCEGCRHIMFLALGPQVKQNYISTQQRIIPDFAVTAASILDVDMEYATGEIMSEIFTTSAIENTLNKKFYYNQGKIYFNIEKTSAVKIEMFDITGKKIDVIFNGQLNSGKNNIQINTSEYNGIYILNLQTNTYTKPIKVIL
ncbi:MAG: alkaline phosphatase family protein [Bacteroidales bacterium]|nr:alkaline phosphatase family protein [Bacteroidales bacterium]